MWNYICKLFVVSRSACKSIESINDIRWFSPSTCAGFQCVPDRRQSHQPNNHESRMPTKEFRFPRCCCCDDGGGLVGGWMSWFKIRPQRITTKHCFAMPCENPRILIRYGLLDILKTLHMLHQPPHMLYSNNICHWSGCAIVCMWEVMGVYNIQSLVIVSSFEARDSV